MSQSIDDLLFLVVTLVYPSHGRTRLGCGPKSGDDVATLLKHGAADGGSTGASRVDRGTGQEGGSKERGSKERGGEGEPHKKSLEIRHLRIPAAGQSSTAGRSTTSNLFRKAARMISPISNRCTGRTAGQRAMTGRAGPARNAIEWAGCRIESISLKPPRTRSSDRGARGIDRQPPLPFELFSLVRLSASRCQRRSGSDCGPKSTCWPDDAPATGGHSQCKRLV